MPTMGESDHIEFSSTVEERGSRYVLEIPRSAVSPDQVDGGLVYRVALFAEGADTEGELERADESSGAEDQSENGDSGQPTPPVEQGDTRRVTILSNGRQGDGIAKIDGGFVIFVSGAEVGDEVLAQIAEVEGTYAHAEVIKYLD